MAGYCRQWIPFTEADLNLFVDGSSFIDPKGQRRTGYAVVDCFQVIESGPLPANFSAQVAELVALTRACILAKGNSRYAFGVVHDFGAIWRLRGYLTSSGSPILNHTHVKALLDALMMPSAIAVIKIAAHTKGTDAESKSNDLADKSAKEAAGLPFTELFQGAANADPTSLTIPI
ncbi:ribonuclease H-like [Spea bombifrons]|uniref:ribonuclease H-like n=1 Tax=Spea bombifrons TaxID=233779 RepID=UPI0023495D6F|nr:ribonuclease H-like [Spea bombifrons]